eukprot:CAMPEP_0183829426 /NCGR_PEP_ID=MMETSP0807_2-20130328/3295_1 /TAXON_ID=88271 /ORGANISM="Picocystis salinarum, Strain CCMP1897" /LENGTH=637 /DNA_ID=CAMNT_0026074633 /DNA_START=107 /DNA_END=2017 /DNA_ORIENTATION=-
MTTRTRSSVFPLHLRNRAVQPNRFQVLALRSFVGLLLLLGCQTARVHRHLHELGKSRRVANWEEEELDEDTTHAVSKVVSQTGADEVGSLYLRDIYCPKHQGTGKSDPEYCRIVRKCTSDITLLETIAKCVLDSKPAFKSWRFRSQYFEPNLVPSFINALGNVPQSVLELGSRSGGYLMDFKRFGTSACVGIEQERFGRLGWYAPHSPSQQGPVQFRLPILENVITFNILQSKLLLHGENVFDVVLSLDNSQGMGGETSCSLLNFLASKTGGWLVTSISQSSSDRRIEGTSIAEDYKLEWLRRGFVFDQALTVKLRNVTKHAPQKKTLLVFRATQNIEKVHCVTNSRSLSYDNKLEPKGMIANIPPLQVTQVAGMTNISRISMHANTTNTYATKYSHLYLMTIVPSGPKLDSALLGHFIQHYTSIGIPLQNFLIVVHGTPQHAVKNLVVSLHALGIRFIRTWFGPFDSRRKILEWMRIQQEANIIKEEQWIVLADIDELHDFRLSLPETITHLESNGYDGLTGHFADRVADKGMVPQRVVAHTSLLSQFPLACPLTKEFVHDWDWKVVLFRASFRTHNHYVYGYPACRELVLARRFRKLDLKLDELCSSLEGKPHPRIMSDTDDYDSAVVVVHHFKW